jgi:hypothetical protein
LVSQAPRDAVDRDSGVPSPRTPAAMLLGKVLPYKDFRATSAVLTHIGG